MFQLILAAAGVASSVLSAKHEMAVQDINIRREKKAAEMRADDRREELRKQLAAARVSMIGQGSGLGSGDLATNQTMSLLGYSKDTTRDWFNTSGQLMNLENAKLSSAFEGISGASNSLLTAYKVDREGKTGVTGG